MTGRELLHAYATYLARHRLKHLPPADEDAPVARLYGTDEVEFGHHGKIKLAGLPGWIHTSGLELPESFGWLALVVSPETGETDIIVGEGSPYSGPVADGLPTQDGLVLALPNALLSGRTAPPQ